MENGIKTEILTEYEIDIQKIKDLSVVLKDLEVSLQEMKAEAVSKYTKKKEELLNKMEKRAGKIERASKNKIPEIKKENKHRINSAKSKSSIIEDPGTKKTSSKKKGSSVNEKSLDRQILPQGELKDELLITSKLKKQSTKSAKNFSSLEKSKSEQISKSSKRNALPLVFGMFYRFLPFTIFFCPNNRQF